MDPRSLVVAANRGPVSFARDEDGQLVTRRGGGGLVTALVPLIEGTGATWIGAAMNDADRAAAAGGVTEVAGLRYRCLDIEPTTYRLAYDTVANAALWFVHHHLFDLPRRPRVDRHWREGWEGYREYNRSFARAVADEAPDGAVVLVQDYHLTLVAAELSAKRPDLRTVHFHHTPFADPGWFEVLPDQWREEMLSGLAGFTACGFHSDRWRRSFLACCQAAGIEPPEVFVSALPAAAEDLAGVARSGACQAEGEAIEALTEGRKLIVRVDRMELSKNIVRGFFAFDELLDRHPELRGEVIFAAYCYPSREGIVDYLAYHQEVISAVEMVNQRWARGGWTPIVLHDQDNFPRSVAALQRYDVLLVNPVRDGLNLVAKEGALLNRQGGLLVLSRQAGVWDELGEAALGVNPFDITATAEAMAVALAMPEPERSERSAATAAAAGSRSLRQWLDDQLVAAGVDPGLSG
jgi:trehalose 6-phosphate synthase